ncbi:MAG: ParA family protein [Magnetococcus sp. YQC-5]
MRIPEKFLSWVDVSRWLWKISWDLSSDDASERPPENWIWAQTYWDRLILGIVQGSDRQKVLSWLADALGPRWDGQEAAPVILLDGRNPEDRLPVAWEELSAEEVTEWKSVPFHPRFSPPRTIRFQRQPCAPPPDLAPDQPPLLVFHSFKGGVGRTLCALALTQAYAKRKHKVLLVDADFEAPGISFLVQKRKPDLDFSLADFFALLHADPDPQGGHALARAKEKVTNQRLDSIYVLPCFRDLTGSVALEIRPEHLVASSAHDPFFLTDILSRLGKELGAEIVIVDLRAGLSELSAPLLLDPRVKRLLVSTVSGQSIQGTRFMIGQMGRILRVNQWPNGTLPALILNQVPVDVMPRKGEAIRNGRLQEVLATIEDAFKEAFSANQKSDAADFSSEWLDPKVGIIRSILPYNVNLALLSDDWQLAMETLRENPVSDEIWNALKYWLPTIGKTKHDHEMVVQPDILDQHRRLLSEFAGRLLDSEKIYVDDFFISLYLFNLAQDHVTKVPIVVSVGGHGAGKTFTFMNIVSRGYWSEFVNKVNADFGCNMAAPVLPILWSRRVDSQAMEQVQARCQEDLQLSGSRHGFELPVVLSRVQNELRDVESWRSFWVNAIAWSLGFPQDNQDAGVLLLNHLIQKQLSLVAMFDGLEDIFAEFTSNPQQKMALRVLLEEVPNWLRMQPGTPIGVIVFIRDDMVSHAILQNRSQFELRYINYAMKWFGTDIVELVGWIGRKSMSFFALNDRKTQFNDVFCLIGNYDYILMVLRKFVNFQIRDIVRFLQIAANESVGNEETTDCLLAPTAMRQAIRITSDNWDPRILTRSERL